MLIKKFNSILDLIVMFPDQASCIKHLESIIWKDGIKSPFDPSSVVYKASDGRYICKKTRKYFTVLTGSIFEGTKIPLQKWFLGIYLATAHKKGISSHQLARDLAITQKSAWYMLQKIRHVLVYGYVLNKLEGIVEMDESYVGGKEKNKHRNKKTGDRQGRSTKVKAPVFGMIQRGGEVRAWVVKDSRAATIQPIVKRYVEPGSVVMTDEWHAYRGLNAIYDHRIVNHGAKQYVSGNNYTNTIEGYWAWIKRSIFGINHSTSKQHLQGYVDLISFKYNTRNCSENDRFVKYIQLLPGTRVKNYMFSRR